jgi:farnesyl diphosphate synthase
MDFISNLKKIAADVDAVLNEMIPAARFKGDPIDVTRYATIGKGKRIRPFLTVQAAQLFGVPYESAVRAGACIEMVHNFSLVHDDMPCIDNDTVRNGKPSAWAQFGEWQALLGGDFGAIWPYKIMATDEKIHIDPVIRLELSRILSEQTCGMIMGEWMDTQAEAGEFQTQQDIDEIQNLKTGCLFNCCTMFGATLGHANEAQRAALKKYTDAMGLCFQITDDILDATGDPAVVGKTLGKDAAAGKATYISLLGIDGARAKVDDLVATAKDALSLFDERADNLRALMDYMVNRES